MRLHVDAWDPSYGRSLDTDDTSGGPTGGASSAPVDAGVEREPASWAPLTPPGTARAPRVVLLVDGVRRIDARVWVEDDDGTTRPGLCASYAAGVVRCDLSAGVAELVCARVEHGLFAPGAGRDGLSAHGRAVYQPHPVNSDDPAAPEQVLQRRLYELEVAVSEAAREPGGDNDGDLLVVDGPLRGRTGLPRALGYAKTHHRQYLPADLTRIVTGLGAGQRSPLFLLGGSWHRYSWYLRLPGPPGSPWSGVVRLECPSDRPVGEATEAADVSTVTLPRFASTPYKDPRAPQNLVPIAGLERRLRMLLGDPRLLLRGLRSAAARTPAATR